MLWGRLQVVSRFFSSPPPPSFALFSRGHLGRGFLGKSENGFFNPKSIHTRGYFGSKFKSGFFRFTTSAFFGGCRKQHVLKTNSVLFSS